MDHGTFVNRDMTDAQRRKAGSYQENDVLHFGSKARGFARGSHLQIAAVDRTNNRLILHGRDGTRITFNPASVQALEVFRWERTIAAGDRLQSRTHDKERSISRNSLATITELAKHKRKSSLIVDGS
jgi:hypothetical protein